MGRDDLVLGAVCQHLVPCDLHQLLPLARLVATGKSGLRLCQRPERDVRLKRFSEVTLDTGHWGHGQERRRWNEDNHKYLTFVVNKKSSSCRLSFGADTDQRCTFLVSVVTSSQDWTGRTVNRQTRHQLTDTPDARPHCNKPAPVLTSRQRK